MDTLAAHSQHEELSMTDGLSVGGGIGCVCVLFAHVCVFNPMTTKLLKISLEMNIYCYFIIRVIKSAHK